MASSWDQRRLLGGSDVWAGAGRTRRIWVGRDGREEDFMGKASREKMMRQGLRVEYEGTSQAVRLQSYPWSQATWSWKG